MHPFYPVLGKGSLNNPIVVEVSPQNAVDASLMYPFSPVLGKGSLNNPIVVAVSTRNAVDASEMHPFEFWSWTKIRRGFAALFFAAFIALIAAIIAIIVIEAGNHRSYCGHHRHSSH